MSAFKVERAKVWVQVKVEESWTNSLDWKKETGKYFPGRGREGQGIFNKTLRIGFATPEAY